MGRKFPKGQKCVYCDERAAEDRDHVVPRQLFPFDLPSGTNLPTVPSCRLCNWSFKESEEKLRLMLALNWPAAKQSTLLRSISDGPVNRLLKKDPRVRALLRDKIRHVRLSLSEPGDERYAPALVWNLNEIAPAMRKIVRGLYWYLYRRSLPKSYNVSLLHLEGDSILKGIALLKQLNLPRYDIIPDVFEFSSGNAHEDPYCSMWMLRFFGSLHVSAFTFSEDQDNTSSNSAEAQNGR
jgi:hypothetical protein